MADSKVYNTAANTRVMDLLPARFHSALDIGCGTGRLCQELASRAELIDGVTFSQAEREVAARHCRAVWLHDLENGLPMEAQAYDVVVLSHIMEHIAKPQKLMEGLARITRSNSVVVCAIPNMLFLYNRLKLLTGRVEYEEYGIMDYTHVRWYTRETLVRLFQQHGFSADAFRANGNLPLGPLRRILPKSAQAWLDEKIVARFPGLLAWEFVFRFRVV